MIECIIIGVGLVRIGIKEYSMDGTWIEWD